MFNLTPAEYAFLKKLNTPIKIQNFLDTLSINFEPHGETNMSPRRVLRERKAHCMEASIFAAACLWIAGQDPLILNMKAFPHDDDHSIALYRINGLWGAISKTNHTTVRFRDPVYKSVRELMMSYFHEYFLNKNGRKVLQSYSKPINMKRFGYKWITKEQDLFDLAAVVNKSPHTRFIPKRQEKFLRPADRMERKAGTIVEWQEN